MKTGLLFPLIYDTISKRALPVPFVEMRHRFMRILLAEDELALARVILKIFEKNNYSADAVHNGEDALTYLDAGNYDVLVLDVMMPKLDGISVLK